MRQCRSEIPLCGTPGRPTVVVPRVPCGVDPPPPPKGQSFGVRASGGSSGVNEGGPAGSGGGTPSETSIVSVCCSPVVEEGIETISEGSLLKLPELFNRDGLLSIGATGLLEPRRPSLGVTRGQSSWMSTGNPN